MFRISITFIIVAALVAPLLAQDDVLRVEYVEFHVDASGKESIVGGGTHYIHGDGRHRHDLVQMGEELSYYRLPAAGVTVSVNHRVRVTARTEIGSFPWNPSTQFGYGPPRAGGSEGMLDMDLGERAHGPMLLHGAASEDYELWAYHHPLTSTDPIRYPPIAIESTMVSTETGETFGKRIVSAARVPMEANTFTVPYERPETDGRNPRSR